MILDDDITVIAKTDEAIIEEIRNYLEGGSVTFVKPACNRAPKTWFGPEAPKEDVNSRDDIYTINPDKTVTLKCSVEFLQDIPDIVRLRDTNYGVMFYGSGISTLRGCPNRVHGNLVVRNTRVQTLEGLGEFAKNLTIDFNENLTSLKGCVKKVKGYVVISRNSVLSDFRDLESAKELNIANNGRFAGLENNFYNGSYNPIDPEKIKKSIRGLKTLSYGVPKKPVSYDVYAYRLKPHTGWVNKDGKFMEYGVKTVSFKNKKHK